MKAELGRFEKELEFGHESYVRALKDRLRRHFEKPGEEPALVAGLFGEWGCGKTAWLRRLEWLFEEELETAKDGKEPEGGSVTVPVFFNAWRFEKEEHLIVPLLKTAQERLAGYEEKTSVGEWLKDKAELMGEAVAAIAHGLKGKLSVPFVAELEADLGAMFAQARMAGEELEKKKRPVIDQYASLYYDLVDFLETLTGRMEFRKDRRWPEKAMEIFMGRKNPKWKKLNLLFLIDDLDRCLPEKAVEMLEAIKLFLEVEGCAFVLGIDDEVVDRGILHRYRDYNLAKIAAGRDGEENRTGDAGNGTGAPVTGSEYLEKIVHLPVRVPTPGRVEVKRFLMEWGGDFFKGPETGRRDGNPEGEKAGVREEMQPADGEDPLLETLAELLPPVPRKIVRAGELLCLLAEVNDGERGAGIDRETLALLGLIQLFAPALYRRLRRNPGDLLTLCYDWPRPDQAGKKWESPEALAKWLEAKKEDFGEKRAQGELNNLHRRWKPLAAALAEVAAPRSGFDVYKVLGEIKIPVDAGETDLQSWFALVEMEKVEGAQARRAVGEGSAKPEGKPGSISSLGDARAFLEAFGVRDSGAWAAAVEKERNSLRGRRLAPKEVGKLKEIAAGTVSEWDAETRVRWLAALKPWVVAGDFGDLKEAAKWEDARKELDGEDVEPKARNDVLPFLDVVKPRRGVGLNAKGEPDIEWVEIPKESRTFKMGASEKDGEARGNERPQHEVVLTGAFEIARYPVTRTQFGAFLEDGAWKDERWWEPDEGWGVGEDALEWLRSGGGRKLGGLRSEGSKPVVGISWYAAMAYCRWLGVLRGETILLPTEAQWECAVRAARPMAGEVYPWGSGYVARDLLSLNANMRGSGIGKPSVVGAFSGGRVELPDGGEIDDMLGNVWEWCLDGMIDYGAKSVRNPHGSMRTGFERMLRGGGCWNEAWCCRCAYRFSFPLGGRSGNIGFRMVRLLRQAGPPGPERSAAAAGSGAPRDAGKARPETGGAE